MLQVSRPSVREAMRGLQILGVVKTRQGGGAYISSLDAADLLGPLQFLITLNAQNVDALYESRVLIDGGIARMAAERLTDADIDRLAGDRHRPDASSSTIRIGFRVSDLEFHRTIMEATGNPVPRPGLALPLRARHGVPPHRLGDARACSRSRSPTTRLIVAAFAARDPDAAEQGDGDPHARTSTARRAMRCRGRA